MKRGEIWWAQLPTPQGSAPGFRHPVLVISTDPFNDTRISTVVVVVLTSNLRLAGAPGNVRLAPRDTGLRQASVANVSQLLTVDKGRLLRRVGHLAARRIAEVEIGLRRVLGL